MRRYAYAVGQAPEVKYYCWTCRRAQGPAGERPRAQRIPIGDLPSNRVILCHDCGTYLDNTLDAIGIRHFRQCVRAGGLTVGQISAVVTRNDDTSIALCGTCHRYFDSESSGTFCENCEHPVCEDCERSCDNTPDGGDDQCENRGCGNCMPQVTIPGLGYRYYRFCSDNCRGEFTDRNARHRRTRTGHQPAYAFASDIEE